jgi:DNA topoisomerase-3
VQLIIAEKPSVARDLARVLGVRPTGAHSFEGSDRVITWCVGHLVELDEPAAYDPRWRAWRLDSLPMIPREFRLRPSRHAAAQLGAVIRLLGDRRFGSVVNACDAGREGELIFRYLAQFAGRCPPVQRLWISSLTDDAIRRGFAALRPGEQFDRLADAARSRSEADWLVGMNATRAITARSRVAGDTALYSIGRVQTPTLAMLVHREQAIRAFVPRPYWEIRGTFTSRDGQRFTATWRRGAIARLATAGIADAITARDAAHGSAADPIGPRVERLRARTVREPPPLLFDLTALQRTANRRFGFSAARTLEIAQALYERHKIITYPRTDARHLSSDVATELPRLWAALAVVPEYAGFVSELVAHPPRPSRRVVDDARVHDHHAIIPTGATGAPLRVDALDRDERRVFDLIARRLIAAFYPDAEFAVAEAWIRVGAAAAEPPPDFPTAGPAARSDAGNEDAAAHDAMIDALPPAPDRYLARGRVRVIAGWQAVAGIEGARTEGARTEGARTEGARIEPDPPQPLPELREGQALDGAFAAIAKQTVPPPRYTEAGLLGAMESAGKAIDDDALRLAMKDRGLGTPATRAAIIETLLARDYVVRSRQDLVPTPRGLALIAALPVASLASPELTGGWEARLTRIARGDESRASFMADIARYVADTVDAIRAARPPAAPASPSAPPVNQFRGRDSCSRSGARRRTGSRSRDDADRSAPRRAPGGPSARDPAPHRAPGGPSTRDPAPRRAPGGPSTRDPAPRRAPGSPSARDPLPRRTSSSPSARDPLPRRTSSSPSARDPAPNRAPGGPSTRDPAPHRTSSSPSARDPLPRRTSSSPAPRDPLPRRTSSSPAPRDPLPRRTSSSPAPRDPAPRRAPAAIAIPELPCPRCRLGVLITGARGWGCARWRDGCRFVIWFETAGRRLTAVQLRDLVTRGKTRKARFRSALGEVDGRLVLDPAADGGARLEPA